MRGRSRKQNNTVKRRPTRIQKFLSKCKQFIAHEFKWLFTTLVSIIALVVSFLAYHTSNLQADIRPIRGEPRVNASFGDAQIDKEGACSYDVISTLPFKNYSSKMGFINNVDFTLLKGPVDTKFTLKEIAMANFNGGEEKDVIVRYTIRLYPQDCKFMEEQGKALEWHIKCRDNTGKPLDRDINNKEYVLHCTSRPIN